MPAPPQAKRGWDGYDVRAYPRAVDAYKRTSKDQHPAKDFSDSGDEEPQVDESTSLPSTSPAPESIAEAAPSASASEVDRFSVCIVGAGAIGCHLAYTLHRAGVNVTLIARGENLRALQSHGLHIKICGEDIGPVHIPVTDSPASVGHVDYVFLTMKVSGYDSSITSVIAPLIGPETTILPPTTSIPYWWFHKYDGKLSGKRLERVDPGDQLWSAMNPDQVIGFTMWLSAVQHGPGRTELRHVQRGYPIGELDGSSSDRVRRLAEALERGGVPAPQVSNIRSEIFIKSINSLAFNIVAVLGNAINGVIAAVPEAVESLRQVMVECEVMAHAMGIPILQSAEDRIRQTLSAHMHTMSMLHDLRSGKKLELRTLWESVCDLAEALDVKLPVTKALVGCALLREVSQHQPK